MTVGDFEHKNQGRWQEYERLLVLFEKGKRDPQMDQLPRLFREVCLDLSLARARMYGSRITERLNGLVIRGNDVLYRRRRLGAEGVLRFVKTGGCSCCAVWHSGCRF